MARGKKIRMDDWDKPKRGWSKHDRCCSTVPRPSLHRKGEFFFLSLYGRSKDGIPFAEVKSEAYVDLFAGEAYSFLSSFLGDLKDYAIITTPARRHFGGFHFATAICRKIAEAGKTKFYEGAIQCTNRDRLNPSFFLLRPIAEKRIIIIDDIITTGMTMKTTYELFQDKEQVFCMALINNR